MTPEIEEARRKCKTDLLYLGRCLSYDFQDDVHRPLFDLLLKFREGAPLRDLSEVKNRLILWPRGHFKSSAMACFIVQLILNYPDIRVLIMQGNLGLTKKWLKEIKSHFLTEGKLANPKSLLPKLFPEFCAPALGNASEFTVPARQRMHLPAATVTVASPNAVSTGQHYDVFFPDDLVNSKNYRNVELLDKLMEDVDLFQPLIDPGGYTFMTGTRYHHADCYGRIIRRNQGEWVVSTRAASLTGKWPVADDQELLFPVRETPDGRKIGFTRGLLQKISEDSPDMFYAQYMNRIVASGNQLFTNELLMKAVKSTQDKDFPANSFKVFIVDLASTDSARADNSVLVVGTQDARGRIYTLDCIGSTFSPFALATVIIQQFLKHRPVRIVIEKAVGAEFFVEYLLTLGREKGLRLPVELLKTSRQKDAKNIRISSLEGALRTGRLLFAHGIMDFEKLVEEFTQFPKGEHDDRPDCISLLVQYLSQQTPFRPEFPGPKLPWFVTAEAENPITDDKTLRPSVMGDGWTC